MQTEDPMAEACDPSMGQTQADPWRHRSMLMKCKTCMWYCPKGDAGIVGRCRRRSPSMNGYPVVYPLLDWCGDHKLDEMK
jgi:hypothetical protein